MRALILLLFVSGCSHAGSNDDMQSDGDMAVLADAQAPDLIPPRPFVFFRAPITLATGGAPSGLVVAALRSGELDIATINSGSGPAGTVSVLPQVDAGVGWATMVSYGSGGGSAMVPSAGSPSAIAAGEFNGDGQLDLVVANTISDSAHPANSDYLAILHNSGGAFAMNVLVGPVGQSPASLAVADFDGDSKVDIAVAVAGDNKVQVRWNDGAGFTSKAPLDVTVGTDPESLATADFDSDGRPDLVVANQQSNELTFLFGKAGGGFNSRAVATAGRPLAVIAADVDGDGKADALVCDEINGYAIEYRGDGSGQFTAQAPVSGLGSPVAAAVGDLDGDGTPDLVAVDSNGARVVLVQGIGNALFGTLQSVPVGQRPSAVVLADVDHDGRLDLIVTNSGNDTVTVLQNRAP